MLEEELELEMKKCLKGWKARKEWVGWFLVEQGYQGLSLKVIKCLKKSRLGESRKCEAELSHARSCDYL